MSTPSEFPANPRIASVARFDAPDASKWRTALKPGCTRLQCAAVSLRVSLPHSPNRNFRTRPH